MTARQNDPETIREEGVNVLLAQSLRDHGVSARAERRSRRGTPDIRVELGSGDLVTTEGGWVAMKKADLEELPVLDTRRLSQTQVQGLSDLFDGLAEAEFERLPGMATCSTRRSLDDGISRILGLPNLTKLRDLLGVGACGI